MTGFERWQSANQGLPLGSVKDHLGSIGVVEASRMEVGLMESAHLVLGTAFGSFPAMDSWVKVIDFSYKEGGAIEQYTFCTAAILDFKMAATKNYI